MATLITTPNIADCDRFYERLMAVHRNLDEESSAAANARLVLILANHIGDLDVLEAAMALAETTAHNLAA